MGVLQLPQLIKKNSQNNSLTELELENSLGSGSSAGKIVDAFEEFFNKQHIETFVSGGCYSTCANIFLLGENRTMLPESGKAYTHLMIHAYRNNQTKEINFGLTDKTFKKSNEKSNNKFPLSLLERIYDDKNGTGSGELYIFREPYLTTTGTSHVLICQGKNIKHLKECEPILGITPEDLGIKIVK